MTPEVLAAAAAVLAMVGVYFFYTAIAFGWRGLRFRELATETRATIGPLRTWMSRAGLPEVRTRELASTGVLVAVIGGLLVYVLFGAVLPAVVAAIASSCIPVASFRARRTKRIEAAREAWPRLLEELRLLIGSMGRSVPQALFEVGRRAPQDWRQAFDAAEREWLLTTDFARTTAILKERLADATADVVCETLLVAHHVGGSDIDGRLSDLIDDRVLDLQGRKDAASRQAGVRFARRFVLLVPLGMALAGLAIGTGRSAYETSGGQIAVAVGLLAVLACWVWSGQLMRLPQEPRVFK